jgi:hypothetical protein
MVVGIDIRNEIHDQDGIVITWGQTGNADSDWKAATMLADAAIRDANAHVLVIVSGLCRSFDLRAMQDLPNYRSKYVFSTHTYTWSWWFTRVDWKLVFGLSLLFIVSNLCAVYYLSQKRHMQCSYNAVVNYRSAWPYVLASGVSLPLYSVVVNLVWIAHAKDAGCSSIADDATPTLYLSIFVLFVVVVAWLVLVTHENVIRYSRLVTYWCLWNACLGAVQAGFSVFYQTYAAVLWELRRWESRHTPVFVGEFGTVVGDSSVEWGWLMTYIADMHYAYWPLNGCAQPFDKFINDTYGILDCDWQTVRNSTWTSSIFPQE